MNFLLHELRGATLTPLFSKKAGGKSYKKTCFSSLYMLEILQKMVMVGRLVIVYCIDRALQLL